MIHDCIKREETSYAAVCWLTVVRSRHNISQVIVTYGGWRRVVKSDLVLFAHRLASPDSTCFTNTHDCALAMSILILLTRLNRTGRGMITMSYIDQEYMYCTASTHYNKWHYGGVVIA